MVRRESARDHGQFAYEQTERRQPADGHCGQAEQQRRRRHRAHQPGADAPEIKRLKMLVDVARRKKEDRFGERVVAHVQQRAEDGER